MEKIDILGVKIDNLDEQEAISKAEELIQKDGHSLLCTPNSEFIIRSQNDADFRDILNRTSKLNLADGIGLLWAAKFNSLHLPEQPFLRNVCAVLLWIFSIILIPFYPRWFKNPLKVKISGSDFIWPLCQLATDKKYRVFLLGGAPTIAERVALKLQTDIFGLRIAGVHSGSPKETEEIIQAINKSKADIILVAFGSPKQEVWLKRNLNKTCCKIGMGVGGAFDFIAGVRPRAPYLMQKLGLEWLFRLIIEPSRIKRQLAIPKFMWLVLISKLKENR